MSKVPDWFERKFEYSVPVEMLPNLRVRLWGSPLRLEEMLLRCPPQVLVEKPHGKWSAQEHAGHLVVLDSLWLERVRDYASPRNEQLTPADLTNRATNEADFNAIPMEDILSEFRLCRGMLIRTIDNAGPAMFEKSLPHPRLKTPMRLVDHLYFAAEHDDHHLARIWEILSAER